MWVDASACACMWLCACMQVHVRLCVCVYVHTSACVWAWVCACTYVRVHGCAHARICICPQLSSTYAARRALRSSGWGPPPACASEGPWQPGRRAATEETSGPGGHSGWTGRPAPWKLLGRGGSRRGRSRGRLRRPTRPPSRCTTGGSSRGQ